MKIVLNTENIDLFNAFYKSYKDSDIQIINAKIQNVLFDNIEKGDADAYILSNNTFYFKKAVDFIKKSSPYVPIVGITITQTTPKINADIYMNEPVGSEGDTACYIFAETSVFNINSYVKTFATLRKLTAKMHDKIDFANCTYDPTRRILYYKDKEVKKLSIKEGGIVEILASNYGEVVKKEVILEKVWRKTDYYAGRSMDVYISYLRKTFERNKIKLSIKNVSGIGLILE